MYKYSLIIDHAIKIGKLNSKSFGYFIIFFRDSVEFSSETKFYYLKSVAKSKAHINIQKNIQITQCLS